MSTYPCVHVPGVLELPGELVSRLRPVRLCQYHLGLGALLKPLVQLVLGKNHAYE